ncbi:MAG TPA: zf-HC2 domain-containing protein [Pseudonocardiaceae bacterium]|nr:zf-HC2 domain-containing protein [Pseudonocardiaceae bacterium]
MDCTQCKEALSAGLDGEGGAVEQGVVDAHLKTCAACRRFGDDAARVTRLARTAVATPEPDVVDAVLAAAPSSPRWRPATALRVLLGLVGIAQIVVALSGVLAAQASGHDSQGIVLKGASVTHFAHESAAWNLALGVGFLWIAWRSSRTSGMVPTLTTFVTVLAALVVLDVVAGRVDPERFVLHGLVLLGLILVIVLDRLPRPAGGTVPGARALGPPWSGRSRRADPAMGTEADGLPPDLRPTAQRDGSDAAQRRTA